MREWKHVAGRVVHDVVRGRGWRHVMSCNEDTGVSKISYIEAETNCLSCLSLRGPALELFHLGEPIVIKAGEAVYFTTATCITED